MQMKPSVLLPPITVALLVLLTSVPNRAAEDERADLVLEELGEASGDREVQGSKDRIELTALKDTSSVSFRLTRALSRKQGAKANFAKWSLIASAPVDKDDDKTSLATLDGLANSFKLTFQYDRFQVNGLRNPQLFDETDPDNVKRSGREILRRKENFALREEICAEMWQNKAAKEARTVAQAKVGEDCDTGNVKTFAGERFSEFRSLYWDTKKMRKTFGLSGSIGHDEFKFLDPTDVSGKNDSKTPWSVKAYYGLLPQDWKTLIVFGAEKQGAYKNAGAATLCGPPDTNGIQTCQSGPLGPPVDDDKDLLFLEARKAFGKVAVSPRLTQDLNGDVFGVDLPVYLVRDKKKIFNGGIRLGWRNDTHDLSAGVFVGSSFSLLN